LFSRIFFPIRKISLLISGGYLGAKDKLLTSGFPYGIPPNFGNVADAVMILTDCYKCLKTPNEAIVQEDNSPINLQGIAGKKYFKYSRIEIR
jgi:hypothetical protein